MEKAEANLSADRPYATKVSYGLTEQVLQAVSSRYKGLKVTKRAALEVALGEWLENQNGN